jgi:hypothetical protein
MNDFNNKRRAILKSVLLMPISAAFSLVGNYSQAAINKKYVLTVQAYGGWDLTYFCDPKINQQSSKVITNWSKEDEIAIVGNISYAPVGNNETFFQNHNDKMLVLHGVDTQTNSHTTGVVHSWSGKLSQGYPSITALHTANTGKSLPMGYVSFGGGYSYTGNQVSCTVAWGGNSIQSILRPLKSGWSGENKLDQAIWDRIRNDLAVEATKISNDHFSLNTEYSRYSNYLDAINGTTPLEELGNFLPSSSEMNKLTNTEQNVLVALSGFKSGTTVAADLRIDGFDTHENNDTQQIPLLNSLTTLLDFLWNKAEELSIADDLLVIVSSDFSRTPYYNSGNGKDHWPINSYIFMGKNTPWTNTVIGGTDEEQNAYKINPNTLNIDTTGTILTPSHIHQEMRRYLGITPNNPLSSLFPFNVEKEIHFLG